MYEGSHKNNSSRVQQWRKGKKNNRGVSTLILLVREAAPVQYVLEITACLEQWQVDRNTVKRHRSRRSEKADLFTSNTVQRKKKERSHSYSMAVAGSVLGFFILVFFVLIFLI